MEATQLRQPNLDPVVYENKVPLKDWYGWCLATVETAFNTPRAFPTAWDAWNGNPDRHCDRNWPRGVYFPIFFFGYGGKGHIAIMFVNHDGTIKIWTSPFEHVPYFYTGYTSIEALEHGYGITYVGWSTQLAGTPIIALSAPAPTITMITTDQLNRLYQQILERSPDPGAVTHYVGRYTADFVRNDLLSSIEYKRLQESKAQAATAAIAMTQAKQLQPAPTSPTGGLPVPTSTNPYKIKTTLKTYGSITDAQNRTNSKGEILAGALWYVFCEKNNMLNITQTPGQSSGTWINPADNEVPAPVTEVAPITRTDTTEAPAMELTAVKTPAPKVETEADIRRSFIPLMPDGRPIQCKTLVSCLAVDALGNATPIPVSSGRYCKVYGTHEAAGHTYATVHSSDPSQLPKEMLGILVSSRDNFAPFLSDPYSLGQRLQVNWELVYDKVGQTIDGVFRALKKK